MLHDFGQPLGGVVQFAYVVEDLDRSMAEFTKELGAGPWFVRGPFQPTAGRYRGNPTSAEFSLARGFSGHVMIELIQQHDDSPSVFNEGDGDRRLGFHHWARLTQDFEGDLERYLQAGFVEAFSDRVASGARVAYMEPTGELPGMIELVEQTPEQERAYTRFYLASVDWDGSEPVRRED